MSASEKIRILLIKRNIKMKELSESLGYKQSNFSNKLRKDDFSEKDLQRIAMVLNCSYDSVFTMNDTGEKI